MALPSTTTPIHSLIIQYINSFHENRVSLPSSSLPKNGILSVVAKLLAEILMRLPTLMPASIQTGLSRLLPLSLQNITQTNNTFINDVIEFRRMYRLPIPRPVNRPVLDSVTVWYTD